QGNMRRKYGKACVHGQRLKGWGRQEHRLDVSASLPLETRRETVANYADTANPDVGKAYGKAVETVYINLDEKDGWMDLVNRLAVQPDETVVVNTPARSGEGVKLYGTLLTESMQELGRRLVTLWVINSQRDSLQLLKDYLDVVGGHTTHVLR